MPKKALQQARELRIKELKSEYRKLATTANRRMTLLETLSENPDYKAVLGYAYKDVSHELEIRGMKRFPHDIERLSAKETDIRKLQGLINVASEFVNSVSSSKSGIDTVYRARARELNAKYEEYGAKFSPSDMRVFFDSTVWKKINDKLGSDPAMITIATVQKNAKQILQEVEDARKAHKEVDFESLKDIDGRDINKELTKEDKEVIETLATMYEK